MDLMHNPGNDKHIERDYPKMPEQEKVRIDKLVIPERCRDITYMAGCKKLGEFVTESIPIIVSKINEIIDSQLSPEVTQGAIGLESGKVYIVKCLKGGMGVEEVINLKKNLYHFGIKAIICLVNSLDTIEIQSSEEVTQEEIEQEIIKFISGKYCPYTHFKSRIVGVDELQDLAQALREKYRISRR